jgi:hypothetical protein
MATNRLSYRVDGDKIIVTSNDINIKQVFFGFGSWGTGLGTREYPEFYGRSIETDRSVRPDNEMWQWDLTMELVKDLYKLISDDLDYQSKSAEDEWVTPKADDDVLKMLGNIIAGVPQKELTPFMKAYITAALWSTLDHSADEDGRDGEHLDDNFGVSDIALEAMEKIERDCNAFLERAEKFLEEAGVDAEQAGHDFWLTREGHGVGFWDRGLGELGDTLTKIAKSFGETYIEVGDDGQLHGF